VSLLNSLPLTVEEELLVRVRHLRSMDFTLDFNFLGAKNDRNRDGLPKPVQHFARRAFSPALFLLMYAIRQAQLILKHTSEKIQSHHSFFAWSADPLRPLSTDSISNRVTRTAKEFMGVTSSVTARSWRIAAANTLIAAGVSIDAVAKLGGWKSVDTLRQHYLRWQPLTQEQWLVSSGNPIVLSSDDDMPDLRDTVVHPVADNNVSPRRSGRQRRAPIRLDD